MAGDWLKIENVTPDKPEILRVAASLNIHPDEAFGKCFRFWRWVDSHTADGHVKGVTAASLDSTVSCAGFSQALASVGWLRVRQDGIEIPNFGRHMSKGAKVRALTNDRKKKHRKKVRDGTQVERSGNAATIPTSSLLFSSKEEEAIQRGVGDAQKKTIPPVVPPERVGDGCIPGLGDITPASLAQQWCFVLVRRKLGAPADLERDLVPRFAELIRLGHKPKDLLGAILDDARPRNEQFFRFEDRLEKVRATWAPKQTAWDAEEMNHGDYNVQTGEFTPNTKSCRHRLVHPNCPQSLREQAEKCQRPQCVAEREAHG
jgi:hypothetical protein